MQPWNFAMVNMHKPEPDDNFRRYKINDRSSRFIVPLNFDNKGTKTKVLSDSYALFIRRTIVEFNWDEFNSGTS